MNTLLIFLGVIVELSGFIVLARIGARLSDRLYDRSKWATIAVSGSLVAIPFTIALVFGPNLTFVEQAINWGLIAFAGGILVRARQRFIDNG
jgi:hypothetical protein